MVVAYYAYNVTLGICFIQFFLKCYKIGTFMGLAYNRDRHPGQKVNPRQQGKRTKPLVLRVTVYAAGFGCRTKTGTRSGDRLYAGFFITGDGMDHRLVFRIMMPPFSSNCSDTCL